MLIYSNIWMLHIVCAVQSFIAVSSYAVNLLANIIREIIMGQVLTNILNSPLSLANHNFRL